MDFDLNLTVDNLVKEETKEDRISIWDNFFHKYERISKKSTNLLNVEDIERLYGNDADFKFVKSGIVKKKRGRSRSQKVNRKNKRTKVLKLDDNLECVVNDVSSASNVDLNLPNCVSEELVSEVTNINTIEELRNHQELFANLTNHELFEFLSESDSSGEILMEDNPSECDLIDYTNLVTHLLSPNVKQIQVNEIVPKTDSSNLEKSYEMENLEDKSDNISNSSSNLVSDWLNKTEPFQKCIPSKHNDVVYFKEPAVSSSVEKNILFDSKTKLNYCNGKCKSEGAQQKKYSKRMSTRLKQLKICETCNNYKSPKEVIKQNNVETHTNNLLNHNQRNISKKIKLEDLRNEASCSNKSLQTSNLEDPLGEESLCNGMLTKCKEAKVCIASKEVEVCHSKQGSGEKPRINQTYNLKNDSDISNNIKTSQEEGLLDLEIKSDDSSAKHESDDEILKNLKIRNFLMTEMFYKRNKRSKAYPLSKEEVHISPTKQNNAELVNCLKKLKSESKANLSAKILEEENIKNLMDEGSNKVDDHGLVKNNKRMLTANSLNGFGQLDEGFRSSSHMNSIISISSASNTSTPMKDKEKSPPQNKDEENYLKIKNKIENELKSNLGYMAYQRYKLHQNSGASNEEETKFWENSVRKEIQKLSRVIPSAVLLRYMKEYINLRINSSGDDTEER